MNDGKLFKWLRLLVVGLFLVSVAVIGVYPVHNQDVYVVVDTDRGNYEQKYTAADIPFLTEAVIEIPNADTLQIREIRIHRFFESVLVDKIQPGNLWIYGEVLPDRIVFNEEFCELLSNSSKSFLLERFMLAEGSFIIALFLCIVLNAIREKMYPGKYENHGPIFEIKRFASDMHKYREYMFYAAKADLNAEVANSYLNRLWWLLEPFCNMLVYVLVFGRIMGNNIQNYATFCFSSLLMWNFFSRVLNYSVKCVRNNRDIVTKIYVPKYILLIKEMILSFIKLLFSITILVVMLIIFKVHIGLAIFMVIPAYLVMFIVAFGIGMILLHYGVFIDDLSYAVGILLTMTMFLSGVFYDVVATLNAPLNGMMLCLNPASLFMDTMRNALLNNLVVNIPIVVLWIIIGLLLAYIGVHIVNKNENGYVKVI